MTAYQIKFATDFWAGQLSQNPAIHEGQVVLFSAALEELLRKRKPDAVCTVVKPQILLTLALAVAEIPEDAFPLSQIDMVFISDGSIRLFQDGQWTTVDEPVAISTVVKRCD